MHDLAAEERVERVVELRLTIVHQESRLLNAAVEIHAEVPSLLKHPSSVGVAGARNVLDPGAANRDECEYVQPAGRTVSTLKKSQASIVGACWRTNECAKRGDRAPAPAEPRLLQDVPVPTRQEGG